MGEHISDRAVVRVLRPFVRATGPMLDALRDADLPGLPTKAGAKAESDEADGAELDKIESGLREKLLSGLSSMRIPGTSAWAEMDADSRTDWWVNRVGRFTALLSAIPGLGGALADRFPVQEALGAASQGLLLCAIAGEYGIIEVGDRVRLMAWVLFDREIDRDVAGGRYAEHDSAAEDAETEQLTEELSEASRKHGKFTLKASARTLWRFGRALLSITDELEKRPRGRLYHRAVGKLPVVGMAGDYFGERSGLKRVVKRAKKWLAASAA